MLLELNGLIAISGGNKVYDVGYLLSEFIIEKWSRAKYLELIVESGNLNKALSVSPEEFEKDWELFVTEKYLNKEWT